jgi:pimeloyl-ACP methyl ester carboxylesterase
MISLLLALVLASSSAKPQDMFVMAADGARLHVLDFGGRGEAVVLRPGLGNTAYSYFEFGQRLSRHFRVVAVTRRSHGRSAAATDYSPEAQARDIRDVMDQLGMKRAVIVGHSLAGAELTAFANLFPDRTAALVYLDAAYDRKLQRQIGRDHKNPVIRKDPDANDLSSMDAYLAYRRRRTAMPGAYWSQIWGPSVEADSREGVEVLPDGRVRERWSAEEQGKFAVGAGQSSPSYATIKAPILAIYADPGHFPFLPESADDQLRAQADAFYRDVTVPLKDGSMQQLRSAVPSATIIKMDNTVHHLFIQHPDQVEKLIVDFVRDHVRQGP